MTCFKTKDTFLDYYDYLQTKTSVLLLRSAAVRVLVWVFYNGNKLRVEFSLTDVECHSDILNLSELSKE